MRFLFAFSGFFECNGDYSPITVVVLDWSAMCSHCDGFLERRRVNSPYEYRDLVRQILGSVEQGTFRLVSGTCSLEEILSAKAWPGDVITHVLECTSCSRRFQLSVETYHGSGGAWEAVEYLAEQARESCSDCPIVAIVHSLQIDRRIEPDAIALAAEGPPALVEALNNVLRRNI